MWSASDGASPASRLADAPATTWVWLGLVALTVAIVVVTFGPAKGASAPFATAREAVDDDGELLDYARQPLPFAALVDPEGDSHTATDLARQGAVLLVFASPGCGPCATAISQLAAWDEGLGPVRVRAVVAQNLEATLATAPGLEGRVLQDPQGATARTFDVGTPGAVLLGGDGLLAGGPVRGRDAVTDFIEDVRSELVEAGVVLEPDAEQARMSLTSIPAERSAGG